MIRTTEADRRTEVTTEARPGAFVKWFGEVGIGDGPLVDGKNASLSEMFRELRASGIRVPNGFALTADAYRRFLEQNGLGERIRAVLADLNVRDVENLRHRGAQVRDAVLAAPMPPDIETALADAYRSLCPPGDGTIDAAVRSSATAEDLPDASFAGQQETYLNVRGVEALVHTCKRCFASLFIDRPIAYRCDKGFDHLRIALSVGVQRMMRSDLATSGVMFTTILQKEQHLDELRHSARQ